MKATTWWWEMIHEYCVFLFGLVLGISDFWKFARRRLVWCMAQRSTDGNSDDLAWLSGPKEKGSLSPQKMGSEWLVDLRLTNDTYTFCTEKKPYSYLWESFFYQPMLWDDMIPFFLSFSVFLKVESTSVDFSRARFSPTRRSKPCLIPEPKNGWRMDDAAVGGKEVPYFLDNKPWWYDFFIR